MGNTNWRSRFASRIRRTETIVRNIMYLEPVPLLEFSARTWWLEGVQVKYYRAPPEYLGVKHVLVCVDSRQWRRLLRRLWKVTTFYSQHEARAKTAMPEVSMNTRNTPLPTQGCLLEVSKWEVYLTLRILYPGKDSQYPSRGRASPKAGPYAMEESNISTATAIPYKKKEKLFKCLANQALPHESVWESGCR